MPRRRLMPILRLAALVAVALAGLAGSAHAATFTVTNLGDATPAGACDGDCTLREAVIAANAAAGDDTITLPAGTITLAEATTGTATPATGDLDLTPGSHITVTGAGAGASVVDGGDKDRIFEVPGGGAALTLRDVTLRNGRGDGSGVLVSAAGGGAASLDVARSAFTGHVDLSTAISVQQSGTATVADSAFTDNGAPVGDVKASPGGAAIIAGDTSTLGVARTTFTRNRSGSSGGAVVVRNDAKATIADSVFENGETANDGGALFVENNSQVNVTGTRFTANSAVDGAGGAIIAWNQSRLDVARSTFTANVAGDGLGGGGAISIWNQVVATIADSTLSGNTDTSASGLSGGGAIGVINQVQLTVERSTIDGNRVLAAPPDTGTLRGGGAIYLLNQADVTLVNTTVTGNSSVPHGGAFLLLNQTRLRLVNATVAGNRSDREGGAFFNFETDAVTPGRLALANTIVAGNTAAGAPNACASDPTALTSVLQSEGHNLESTDTCAFLSGAGDRRGTDAGLAALADNGGPVRTQAIGPGSPALDAADAALCPATDARGIARPQLGGCDIGAFEAQPVPPAGPAGAPTPIAAKPRALTAGQLISFASNRRCISRRALVIRLKQPGGVTLVSATVFVNGKRVTVVKGKRLRAAVNLKRLPKGRYTVKITVVTATGQKVTGTRKYRTCTKKVKRRSRSKV